MNNDSKIRYFFKQKGHSVKAISSKPFSGKTNSFLPIQSQSFGPGYSFKVTTSQDETCEFNLYESDNASGVSGRMRRAISLQLT